MAKTTWGRKESIIWPQHRPIYTYGAIFAAIVLTAVFLYGRLRFIGTPLQRFYMPVYVRTSIFGSVSKTHRSQYRMLFLTGRDHKPSPAMNDDVVHGKTMEPGGRIIPLALSPSALQHGDDLLFRGPLRSYVDARLGDYLKVALYKDDLSAIVKIPLLCGAGIFLILLPFAVTKDVKRQKALKYGRRLKGPEKLTPQEFNEVVKGDGVGFKTDDMKEMIRIPARAEAQHMQFIGDTGAGKSALMFQVLRQVQSRVDSAIVYGPRVREALL
jgi:hypothetical protein